MSGAGTDADAGAGADAGTDADANGSVGTAEAAADPRRWEQFVAVAQREFATVLRSRASLALAGVVGLLVVAVPVVGGTGGFLPLVLDLLLPVELLVPTLAVGLGVWTVLADATRGELEVIRTYPVDRGVYVLGTYAGRATGLLVAVLVPLLVAGVVAATLREPRLSVLAAHATVDSPLYFLRFVVLTAGYALVALALAVGVSTLARTRRQGLALAVVLVLVVVVGFDLLVVAGVGRGVVGGLLPVVLGLSPTGAFRGLVLATATGGLVETGPPAANVLVSVVGLVGWLALALALATVSVWSLPDRARER